MSLPPSLKKLKFIFGPPPNLAKRPKKRLIFARQYKAIKSAPIKRGAPYIEPLIISA